MGEEKKGFRFLWLWVPASAVLAAFVYGSWFGLEYGSSIRFLDRHWASLKQRAQRSLASERIPSEQVSLLQLRLQHATDIWFDEELRKNLAAKLLNYPGPIVLSFDPARVAADPHLSPLLQRPKFIRTFKLFPTHPTEIDQEMSAAVDKVSSFIEAKELSEGQLRRVPGEQMFGVAPKNPEYYEGSSYWGTNAFELDQASQFISSYPLTLKILGKQIPTSLLATLAAYEDCASFKLSFDKQLHLQNCKQNSEQNSFELADPIPLFFYAKSLRKTSLEKLDEKSNAILIVEAIDAASYLPTLLGNRTTWGEVYATALSNILEGDTPQRTKMLAILEGVYFAIIALLIGFAAKTLRLKGTLTVALAGLFGAVAFDFFVTVFGNLKSEPIEEFISIFVLGLIGVATRSIVDFEERGLVERALSGYVSSDRLDRLLSGKEKLNLEGRKQELTMMILDIAGFSKITKASSIEEIFQMMQLLYSVTDPIIFKFGGAIDKKTGDGFLAFFGDRDGEDPQEVAEKAVECGLEIQKQLQSLEPEFFRIKDPLTVRIGVNTGEVMIGNTGSLKHFNYTVLGDSVNFTQRLEAACPPGGVLIGTATAEYVASRWTLEERLISVKNETEKAHAFLVLPKESRAETA